VWLRPDGQQMTPADWNEPFAHAVGVTAPGGRFTLLVNAWWQPLTFRLPTELRGERLSVLVDTSRDHGPTRPRPGRRGRRGRKVADAARAEHASAIDVFRIAGLRLTS
jgi:pullulanase/glycogen debranching enzyme